MGGMMETLLPIAGTLAAGVALGLALTGLYGRMQRRGKRSRSRKQAATEQEAKKPETMKRVIWVYSSEADFRKSVAEYILFYNEQRPHQTLAYKSPVRFEELYGQEKTQAL